MMERSRSSSDIIGLLQKQIRSLETRMNRADDDVSLPDWIAPTLLGTWVNFGGAEEPAGFWRNRSGLVLLRGAIKLGTIPSQAFLLPEGFRPISDKRFAVVSAGLFGFVLVQANGNVVVPAGNNASVYLSGVTFRAEQ